MKISQILKRLLPAGICCCLAALGSAQAASDLVYNLTALPGQQQSIVLSWSLPEHIQESGITGFAVYRSTRPIYDAEEANTLQPLAIVQSTAISYTDTVPDDAEYYYAVISLVKAGEEAEISGYEEVFEGEELLTDIESLSPLSDQSEAVWLSYIILPGINATITGVRAEFLEDVSLLASEEEAPQPASVPQKTSTGLRPQPLPLLDPLGSTDTAFHEQKISPQAEENALALLRNRKKTGSQKLEQYIFTEDMASPSGGDEYLLFDVLKTSFIRRKYAAATEELEQFLAQNRTAAVTNRATFYLGEAYYFTGDYLRALNEFLSLSTVYPALSRRWIDSCLDFYQMKD